VSGAEVGSGAVLVGSAVQVVEQLKSPREQAVPFVLCSGPGKVGFVAGRESAVVSVLSRGVAPVFPLLGWVDFVACLHGHWYHSQRAFEVEAVEVDQCVVWAMYERKEGRWGHC
jgi:hypothetical protein